MEQAAIRRSGHRLSSHDKRLLTIALATLAVLSPLYINRSSVPDSEPDPDAEAMHFTSYLPLLLLILITAIAISSYLERGISGLDPYLIHRLVGSSTGIVIVLIVLTLVLKCKA